MDNYALSVVSKTGNTFIITKLAAGTVARTCSVSGGTTKGGCPTSFKW